MNFKNKYIQWLGQTLADYTPVGYKLKIIEQAGQISTQDKTLPKNTIKCYVGFGVGAKQSLAKDRVNQPVTFTIISEGDNFRNALQIFYEFFIAYSKTRTAEQVTEIDDEEETTNTYNVWHTYNTPVVQTSYEQSGLYAYSTIIMTGVLTYAKNKVLGVEYTIAGSVVDLISPEIQYNAVVNSPMFVENTVAKALIESTGNIFTARMFLDNTQLAEDLLYVAYTGVKKNGTKLEPTLVAKYMINNEEVSISIDCTVTQAIILYDNESGDNIIDFTLMIKEELS